MTSEEKRKVEKYLIKRYGADNIVKLTLFPEFVEAVVIDNGYAKKLRGKTNNNNEIEIK